MCWRRGNWDDDRPPLQAYYTDLLADLLHFEDKSGVDGFDAQEMASIHFQQEADKENA